MGRRIDITNSELLHMRENGKTNSDIANALGCSYAFVHKRIGPQPGRGGAVRHGHTEGSA